MENTSIDSSNFTELQPKSIQILLKIFFHVRSKFSILKSDQKISISDQPTDWDHWDHGDRRWNSPKLECICLNAGPSRYAFWGGAYRRFRRDDILCVPFSDTITRFILSPETAAPIPTRSANSAEFLGKIKRGRSRAMPWVCSSRNPHRHRNQWRPARSRSLLPTPIPSLISPPLPIP